MLAVTAFFSASKGVLSVRGDGASNTIEISRNAAETFAISPNGNRVRFDRTSPAPFSLDIGTSENLVVNGNGGDDSISAGNGLAALIQITMDGGPGDDTLLGGDGNDLLLGGDGNDFVDNNRGNDAALLGAGDDVLIGGEGNDVLAGGDGDDVLIGGDGLDVLDGGTGNNVLIQ